MDILFHDFLLEEYGTFVSTDRISEIRVRRADLLEQIDVAVLKDEVLTRTGTMFNRRSAEFYSVVTPGVDSSHTISEEDQIYVWSCINGQMQLDGTDYPIGFLAKFDSVIGTLESGKPYHVLSADVFPIMKKCVGIIIGFVVASWLLVIPYGVSEARSGTQMLSFSTKQGRRSYASKVASMTVISLIVIVMGTFASVLMFSSVGADRYYASAVVSALQKMNLSVNGLDAITLFQLYAVILGLTAVAGLSSSVMIANISLNSKHAVSAIASSLPVIVAFTAWCIVYTQIAFDSGDVVISFIGSWISVGIWVIITCVFSAVILLRKYRNNY